MLKNYSTKYVSDVEVKLYFEKKIFNTINNTGVLNVRNAAYYLNNENFSNKFDEALTLIQSYLHIQGRTLNYFIKSIVFSIFGAILGLIISPILESDGVIYTIATVILVLYMLLLSYYYILFPINLILLFFKFLNLNSYIITHKSSIIKFILKEEKRLKEENEKLRKIEHEKRLEEEAKKEQERQEKRKQQEILARTCKYCNTLDFKDEIYSKKKIHHYDNDKHVMKYFDHDECDFVKELVPVHIEEYEITYKRSCCGTLIKKKCRIIINKRTGKETTEILD